MPLSAARVEALVETSVEIGVEIPAHDPAARQPQPRLDLRLLGTMALSQGGQPVPLPPSRKVRALLAYLAMAGRPTTRAHLCELLWDLPADPRGELRWCLSKLRGVLDEPGRARVLAHEEGVGLDLADVSVDAREAAQALQPGAAPVAPERLEEIAAGFARGDFLEGLELPRSPAFTAWLVAQRRRLREAHAVVLARWVEALAADSERALPALERWLAIAPFELRAHERLLATLLARGRLREAEEHLAATQRRYEAEGQDWGPVALAWRAVKSRPARAAGVNGMVLVEPAAAEALVPAAARRASIAVMPFADRTPGGAARGGLGDGMARDVILRLAKLRSVFVIADGTMFALAEHQVDSQDAGRRLDVDYVASGWLRRGPDARLRVGVQLVQARSAQVVWAEEFSGGLDDTFAVLDEIGDRIVTAIANQIEAAERNRAILQNPNSLNAWEAHHRGLWHMFRFNREDNEQARHFFRTAVRLDPTFSRPHAGLSFTHFQDAFLGWRERADAIAQAHAAAAEGVMADGHDPASHWALGRALWLMDRQDEALRELQEAVDISPNFALGHYTLGFVHSQSGDAQVAITEVDHARALSPMDPLLFGMLASRALALLRLGRYEEAAEWGQRSAARPNAHVHIRAIATFCLAMAGRREEAREMAQAIQRTDPGYGLEDFGRAFKLGPELREMLRQAQGRVA